MNRAGLTIVADVAAATGPALDGKNNFFKQKMSNIVGK